MVLEITSSPVKFLVVKFLVKCENAFCVASLLIINITWHAYWSLGKLFVMFQWIQSFCISYHGGVFVIFSPQNRFSMWQLSISFSKLFICHACGYHLFAVNCSCIVWHSCIHLCARTTWRKTKLLRKFWTYWQTSTAVRCVFFGVFSAKWWYR